MELRWIASTSASCLHAAAAVLKGRAVGEPVLTEALAEPVQALQAALAEWNVSAGSLFDQLAPLAAGIENNRELASVALTKAFGRQCAVQSSEALARSIASLEAAFARAKPDAVDELELRFGPLREQWEARGPGLVQSLRRLTEDSLFVEQADVVLVHPVLGGGGQAYPPFNLVLFEAVLTNPHADLPEVVRLGWLLAQLQLDVPLVSGNLPADRASRLGRLALVPAALAAAQDVELAAADEQRLGAALAAWGEGNEAEDSSDWCDPARRPAVLWQWWETYCQRRPEWPVALAALSQMLRP